MSEFCRHLTNGLDYNNVAGEFTVSPCCYFAKQDVIDSTQNNMGKLRQSWQNSDLEKNCAICLHAESSGINSYRQASFDLMKAQSNKLQHLNVQINKQCNLACPSCTAIHSSFWFQENERNNVSQPLRIKNIHAKDKYESIKNEFLLWLKNEDLSELKYIKFSGGEPLMSDLHLKVLALVDNPSQVTLQYVKLREQLIKKYGNDHTISSLITDVPELPQIQDLVDYLDKLNQWRNQDWRKIFYDVQHYFV